jgi:Primase C terminal 2 (PriCT-2)
MSLAFNQDTDDANVTAAKVLIKAALGNGEGHLVISKSDGANWENLKSQSFKAIDLTAIHEELSRINGKQQAMFGLARRAHPTILGKRGGNKDISHMSVIGMDIDLYDENKPTKHLPRTIEDALTILNSFELKPSMVNKSGTGLHGYWFLNEDLSITSEEDFKAVQRLVKNFYRAFGEHAAPFTFDSTHDIGRSLRIPGSLNLKDPKNILIVEPIYFDEDIKYSIGEIRTVAKDIERSVSMSKPAPSIGKLDIRMVQKGCGWFNRVINNPKTASYDDWFAVGSILFFAPDGESKFHEWSKEYPDYDPEETQKLWDSIDAEKAKRTCETLSQKPLGSLECNACAFKGGVRSPVELGYPGKRKVIRSVGDMPSKSAQVWSAIYTNNNPARLFQNEAGVLRINPVRVSWEVLNSKSLRHESARIADWVRATNDGFVPADPQESVIEDMLQTVHPPLPYLKKVTSTPVITSDGRLINDYLYDEDSQIYRVKTADLQDIEYGNGKFFATVKDALDFIFNDCLVDFPFATSQDKAHALALMLHDFARNLFTGASPLFLIDKPVHGTGASLLANVLCYPSTGGDIPTKIFHKNEEEQRKQITSHLTGGGGPYLLDNISGSDIDSDVLAMALTSSRYSDRLLNTNTEVRLENLGPWIATGNNPGFSGQLSRRFIRIRLVPPDPEPYLREKFKHFPLMPWVKENRSKLVDACITIVMDWGNNGKNLWTGKPLGSFENFSQVMGGILENAGVVGFMSDMEFQRLGFDTETSQVIDFVQEWFDSFGTKEVYAKQLVQMATSADLEILERWGEGSERSQSTRAGKFLKTLNERMFTITIDGEEQVVQLLPGEPRNTTRLKIKGGEK